MHHKSAKNHVKIHQFSLFYWRSFSWNTCPDWKKNVLIKGAKLLHIYIFGRYAKKEKEAVSSLVWMYIVYLHPFSHFSVYIIFVMTFGRKPCKNLFINISMQMQNPKSIQKIYFVSQTAKFMDNIPYCISQVASCDYLFKVWELRDSLPLS